MSRSRRLAVVLGASATLAISGWIARGPTLQATRSRLAERAIAGGRLDEAEAGVDLLVSERPLDPLPRLLRARVARKQGRITDAETALQRAIELGLPVEQGRREFALLGARQDFARAERMLRQVLAEDPSDEEVRRALAEGYARIPGKVGRR